MLRQVAIAIATAWSASPAWRLPGCLDLRAGELYRLERLLFGLGGLSLMVTLPLFIGVGVALMGIGLVIHLIGRHNRPAASPA